MIINEICILTIIIVSLKNNTQYSDLILIRILSILFSLSIIVIIWTLIQLFCWCIYDRLFLFGSLNINSLYRLPLQLLVEFIFTDYLDELHLILLLFLLRRNIATMTLFPENNGSFIKYFNNK